MNHQLIDSFDRKISYLRLSVTDRCDFRCTYCMAEDMTFLPRAEVLSIEELYQLAQTFIGLGIRKIRITGGEPLIRPGLLELVERLAQIPALEELTMTTNGSRLAQFAQPLKDAGLNRINISLDSLRSDRFHSITRTGKLSDVLQGITAAQSAGFQRIKLNSVIMQGRNDDEIIDLVEFARQEQLDISFIEEMPLGIISEHNRQLSLVSNQKILSILQSCYTLTPSTHISGGPARYFQMRDSTIRIGLISPYSHNFCSDCNRVRVSANGQLYLCLGNDHHVDLRAVMRSPHFTEGMLQNAILDALPLKPERHLFDLEDAPQIVRFMNMTGG